MNNYSFNPLANIDEEKLSEVFSDIFPNGIEPLSLEEQISYASLLGFKIRETTSFKNRRFIKKSLKKNKDICFFKFGKEKMKCSSFKRKKDFFFDKLFALQA